MPKTYESVKCEHCGKLISKDRRYIVIRELEVYEKPAEDEFGTEAVAVSDIVVCNNSCLAGVASLSGF